MLIATYHIFTSLCVSIALLIFPVLVTGLSPRKELFRALLAGDEEKSIRIYVSVSNGKSLEEDMYPSLPLLDSDLQTPLHLVTIAVRQFVSS